MKKNRPILLLLLTIIFGKATAQVVPNVDWVQNYSERDQLENVPSAIDGSDNVYITGYTVFSGSRDFTTIKYNSMGVPQWIQHYNNIVGGDDRSNAVLLDGNGNVYVTGQSQGNGTGLDYATVKYNSNGVQQWVARYNGTGNGDDIAVAIVVDNNGNVFVTGKSKGTTSSDDYATVKYNSNGVQQWVSRYNGTANGDDNAVGIALGNGNRVFVTGTSKTTANSNDIVTIRYNANNGNQMWAKSSNGTSNNSDVAYTILADGNNVLVGGMVENNGTSQDYFLIKINGNNSNTIFQKTYDGYGSADYLTAIVQDAQSNYVVTGVSRNTTSIEYHTIMYDNTGNQQWINKRVINQGFTQVSPKLAVDFVDHFYVCGEINNANNIDMLLYQITPGGNSTWTETHNGSLGGNDVAVDLVMGNLGAIYVAGQTQNSNAKFDYTTIKYSQTPVIFPPDFNGEVAGEINFVENRGQLIDENFHSIGNDLIKFYSDRTYPNLYFNTNYFSLLFSDSDTIQGDNDTLHRIDISFKESNSNTKIYAFEPKEEIINYFIGSNPAGITDLHPNKRLLIPNIYPNIDLHYYSNSRGIKLYFVIKPGGNPNVIQLDILGEQNAYLSGNNLVVQSILESIKFDNPSAYQINPLLNIIPVNNTNWVQSSGVFGINVPSYNTAFPLILQLDLGNGSSSQIPVNIDNLCYSSYIGGTKIDELKDIKIDRDNDINFCGYSRSPNYPIHPQAIISTNPLFNYLGVFSRMNGTGLGGYFFTTYFGGTTTNGNQVFNCVYSIDYDYQNNIIITGVTSANNIPISNLIGSNYLQSANISTTNNAYDVFIAKTSYLSNQLYYSTYYGGSGDDQTRYMRSNTFVHSTDIYISGYSNSSDFPLKTTSNGYYNTNGAGFLLRFNENLDTMWTSRIESYPFSIDIDKSTNDVFMTGFVSSTQNISNFPIRNPGGGAYVDSTFNGADDMFVTKFNSANDITWSTFLGGSLSEQGWDIKCRNNVLAIAGSSGGGNFAPMTNVGGYFDNTLGGGSQDAAILKFTTGGNYVWSSLFGGLDYDDGKTVAIANNGDIYLLGNTKSQTSTLDLMNHSGNYYDNTLIGWDGFIAMFRNGTNQLYWSTLMGGLCYDFTNGVGAGGSYDAFTRAVISDDYRLITVGVTDANTQFPIVECVGCTTDSTMGGITTFMNADSDGFLQVYCLEDMYLGLEDNNITNNNFNLYPNPNNGNFIIELENNSSIIDNIQITDILGKLVFDSKNEHRSNIAQLSLDFLSDGIYLVKVSAGESVSVRKFVIRR